MTETQGGSRSFQSEENKLNMKQAGEGAEVLGEAVIDGKTYSQERGLFVRSLVVTEHCPQNKHDFLVPMLKKRKVCGR